MARHGNVYGFDSPEGMSLKEFCEKQEGPTIEVDPEVILKEIKRLESAIRQIAIPALEYYEKKHNEDDINSMNCRAVLDGEAVENLVSRDTVEVKKCSCRWCTSGLPATVSCLDSAIADDGAWTVDICAECAEVLLGFRENTPGEPMKHLPHYAESKKRMQEHNDRKKGL